LQGPVVPARRTQHDAARANVPDDRKSSSPIRNGEGCPMHAVLDDCEKRRLTERIDIQTAVDILESRGVSREDLLTEITKVFYVDLDEFNRVLRLP
jgi:hypothetical protein